MLPMARRPATRQHVFDSSPSHLIPERAPVIDIRQKQKSIATLELELEKACSRTWKKLKEMRADGMRVSVDCEELFDLYDAYQAAVVALVNAELGED
jgi:hypothetical protein